MIKTCLLATTLLFASTMPFALVPAANPCPDEPRHLYGFGLGAGGNSATASTGEFGVGGVTVMDTNLSECDGDASTMADWDGDYDSGVGGAFFGYGAWADDADCNYALNVHGGNVAVNDFVFGGAIGFVVGEDDQSGPIKVQDPFTLEYKCTTDGNISPCPSTGCDPLDPTQDADDCLSQHYVGTGATCGTGGGDGGYWVFLDGAYVAESGSVTAGNPPTSGTITAYAGIAAFGGFDVAAPDPEGTRPPQDIWLDCPSPPFCDVKMDGQGRT